MEDVYTTVLKKAKALYRDRGSKFIGYACPVVTAAQANDYLQQIKEEHPSATHHCFAWRLGVKGDQYRAYDDGEPSGTAGRPIYDAIRSAGLTNVVVVVVRYYGGTPLGKPGLIQAYKETAIGVLQNAGSVERALTSVSSVRFPYAYMNVVMTELKKADAQILEMTSEEDVLIQFELRTALFRPLEKVLLEKTRHELVFSNR